MFIALGCTYLPVNRIEYPWSRSLGDSNVWLQAKSSLKVSVQGETLPLISQENLTADNVKVIAQSLLERRGFNLCDNNMYELKIRYKTSKESKTASSESVATKSLILGFNYQSSFGDGVSIAQAVSALSLNNYKSIVTNHKYDYDSYCHVLAFELTDKANTQLWKTDVTWQSTQLDIFDNIIPAMQTVFSALPSNSDFVPNVRRIKNERVSDFFQTFIASSYYFSPALPYKTMFNNLWSNKYQQINNSTAAYTGIYDSYAILAYLDLLQTAEFALPGSDPNKWIKPLDPNIWKVVILGGKYTIGDDKKIVNVLINLTSSTNGYTVSKCRLVTDSEYASYLSLMNTWKQVLASYYNFYQ